MQFSHSHIGVELSGRQFKGGLQEIFGEQLQVRIVIGGKKRMADAAYDMSDESFDVGKSVNLGEEIE